MMEKLYNEFLKIARQLNEGLNIKPILYGSLGLQMISHVEFNPQDIDILLPREYVTEKWDLLRETIQKLGYTLADLNEHEFEKDGVKVAFAFEEDLLPFAGVDYKNLEIVESEGFSYKRLALEDYLKVYRKSINDSYRKAKNNSKDNKKIEVIENLLTPTIKGKRITLEFAKMEHKKCIYQMLVSQEVKDFMFDEKHPEPSWEEFDEEPNTLFTGKPHEDGSYLLIKVDGETIGSISYAFCNGKIKAAEMDIWISSKMNLGKGYGTESLRLLTDFIHKHYNTKVFIIRPWKKNVNAIKSYLRAGFNVIENFAPLDFYSPDLVEVYGQGDYGIEETENLIYIME